MTFNPVARLAAAIAIAAILAWSIDPVSAGVALALELALVPFLRIPWGRFWRRTALVWIAAPLSALTLLLYGEPSGRHWLDFGLIHVTDGSIVLAVTIALRVLALALPAVVLFIGVDPTAFADGLAQLVRLPPRFVYGALGALRLAGVFREDYRMLELARRARGVADRGRVRRALGVVFAMLVLSIRRGSALATAMEARGFGAPVRRTFARRSRFGAADWGLIAVALAIAAVGAGAALATGQWDPILGGAA